MLLHIAFVHFANVTVFFLVLHLFVWRQNIIINNAIFKAANFPIYPAQQTVAITKQPVVKVLP